MENNQKDNKLIKNFPDGLPVESNMPQEQKQQISDANFNTATDVYFDQTTAIRQVITPSAVPMTESMSLKSLIEAKEQNEKLLDQTLKDIVKNNEKSEAFNNNNNNSFVREDPISKSHLEQQMHQADAKQAAMEGNPIPKTSTAQVFSAIKEVKYPSTSRKFKELTLEEFVYHYHKKNLVANCGDVDLLSIYKRVTTEPAWKELQSTFGTTSRFHIMNQIYGRHEPKPIRSDELDTIFGDQIFTYLGAYMELYCVYRSIGISLNKAVDNITFSQFPIVLSNHIKFKTQEPTKDEKNKEEKQEEEHNEIHENEQQYNHPDYFTLYDSNGVEKVVSADNEFLQRWLNDRVDLQLNPELHVQPIRNFTIGYKLSVLNKAVPLAVADVIQANKKDPTHFKFFGKTIDFGKEKNYKKIAMVYFKNKNSFSTNLSCEAFMRLLIFASRRTFYDVQNDRLYCFEKQTQQETYEKLFSIMNGYTFTEYNHKGYYFATENGKRFNYITTSKFDSSCPRGCGLNHSANEPCVSSPDINSNTFVYASIYPTIVTLLTGFFGIWFSILIVPFVLYYCYESVKGAIIRIKRNFTQGIRSIGEWIFLLAVLLLVIVSSWKIFRFVRSKFGKANHLAIENHGDEKTSEDNLKESIKSAASGTFDSLREAGKLGYISAMVLEVIFMISKVMNIEWGFRDSTFGLLKDSIHIHERMMRIFSQTKEMIKQNHALNLQQVKNFINDKRDNIALGAIVLFMTCVSGGFYYYFKRKQERRDSKLYELFKEQSAQATQKLSEQWKQRVNHENTLQEKLAIENAAEDHGKSRGGGKAAKYEAKMMERDDDIILNTDLSAREQKEIKALEQAAGEVRSDDKELAMTFLQMADRIRNKVEAATAKKQQKISSKLQRKQKQEAYQKRLLEILHKESKQKFGLDEIRQYDSGRVYQIDNQGRVNELFKWDPGMFPDAVNRRRHIELNIKQLYGKEGKFKVLLGAEGKNSLLGRYKVSQSPVDIQLEKIPKDPVLLTKNKGKEEIKIPLPKTKWEEFSESSDEEKERILPSSVNNHFKKDFDIKDLTAATKWLEKAENFQKSYAAALPLPYKNLISARKNRIEAVIARGARDVPKEEQNDWHQNHSYEELMIEDEESLWLLFMGDLDVCNQQDHAMITSSILTNSVFKMKADNTVGVAFLCNGKIITAGHVVENKQIITIADHVWNDKFEIRTGVFTDYASCTNNNKINAQSLKKAPHFTTLSEPGLLYSASNGSLHPVWLDKTESSPWISIYYGDRDSKTSFGDSGSPVLNSSNEVVGIYKGIDNGHYVAQPITSVFPQ